jgi:CubicO group peptidase (beta-lactamase class C family)
LGFLITADQVPASALPGSLSWGGINNTFFWIDPSRGIAGVIMMQYLPFADPRRWRCTTNSSAPPIGLRRLS